MSFKKFVLYPFFLPLLKGESEYSFFIGKKCGLNNLRIIHNETCELLPEKEARIQLGTFDNPDEALNKGKKVYQGVRLCPYCCNFE